MRASRRPLDPVTYTEAGRILGVTASSVRRRVLAGELTQRRRPGKHGTLSRSDVEALALRSYPYRKHNHESGSYWVTGQRAADILGVNMARVRQLAHAGLIPAERHADGTFMYRRELLMTVANAREARWH
jgi:hypothetical protein